MRPDQWAQSGLIAELGGTCIAAPAAKTGKVSLYDMPIACRILSLLFHCRSIRIPTVPERNERLQHASSVFLFHRCPDHPCRNPRHLPQATRAAHMAAPYSAHCTGPVLALRSPGCQCCFWTCFGPLQRSLLGSASPLERLRRGIFFAVAFPDVGPDGAEKIRFHRFAANGGRSSSSVTTSGRCST